MSEPSEPNNVFTPDWPTCAEVDDSGTCVGRVIEPFQRCFAHLSSAEMQQALSAFRIRTEIDLRGTSFSGQLLAQLVGELKSRSSRKIRFDRAIFREDADFRGVKPGSITFSNARFAGNALFAGVNFSGAATFRNSEFDGAVEFSLAEFDRDAVFVGAVFKSAASFTRTQFAEAARFEFASFRRCDFGGVQAGGQFSFDEVTVQELARFVGAQFVGAATFKSVKVAGLIDFSQAIFEDAPHIGPMAVEFADFTGASFAKQVTVEVDSTTLACNRARFEDGASIRVRSASIDAFNTYFGAPSSVSGVRERFELADSKQLERIPLMATEPVASPVSETADLQGVHIVRTLRSREDWIPYLTRLSGTDVSELVLTDVDLQSCLFAGAHNLDKLRLEGRCTFLDASKMRIVQIKRLHFQLFTRRQMLFEEGIWRVIRGGTMQWNVSGHRVDDLGAERLAGLYRSLRKAFEDGKNEAGAGDFYFGEMEARRYAARGIERFILTAYWMVSGYGQRAGRAVAALVLLVVLTSAALVQWGVAEVPTTFTISPPGVVTATQPSVAILPSDRWTISRVEKAVRIATGSVVFRDVGQQLTPAGGWIAMLGRFLGPVLLALTVLAVRARVKR